MWASVVGSDRRTALHRKDGPVTSPVMITLSRADAAVLADLVSTATTRLIDSPGGDLNRASELTEVGIRVVTEIRAQLGPDSERAESIQ
jgi:hypothetical protein